MREFFKKVWQWYEGHETLTRGVAAGLFTLQLFHLYWLSAHVVAFRLVGQSFFDLSGVWEIIMSVVDYTEIPAIVLTSLVYIRELQKGFLWKSVFYLVALNTQWLHIFWITDEIVLTQFMGTAPILLPMWLSWFAIGIDYLELPVIYDTLKKFFKSLSSKKENITNA